MVGWDGLAWAVRRAWAVFGTLLDLRDARAIIASYGIGVIVGDPVATVVSALRGVPDLVFWPVFFGTTFLVARATAWLLTKKLEPVSRPVGSASTTGENSPATGGANSPAMAAHSSNAPVFQHSGSGDIINVTVPGGAPLTPDEAKELAERARAEAARIQKAQTEQPQATQGGGPQNEGMVNDRVMWLATLASLRNVGVTRRNELAGLRGDSAEIDATAKYVAWLQLTIPEIRKLPVHGVHEAHAFETLDRFRIDAAPVGDYASNDIRLIAAMFSTHLERLEEIRKRYTLVWPV